MFKNFKEKITVSGITVLGIGVALLIFTFFSAYGLLTTDLSPISTQDLVQSFGEALGPLIAAAIHTMYLGVMGWISSLITIRGVTIITHTTKSDSTLTKASQKPQQKPQQKLKKEPNKPKSKRKKETQHSEPEMIVVPQEEIEQKPRRRKKTSSS